MKKILSLCMTVLLLCGWVLPVSAQTPSLRLDAESASVFAGDSLTVTLWLSEALPDVGALEVHLQYDTAAVTLQSASAGSANGALQTIVPTKDAPYTGVLFAYDYGLDGAADKAFRAGQLLTATFTVREDVQTDTLRFSVACAASLDTAFQPLKLSVPADAVQIAVLPFPTVDIHEYVPEKTVAYRSTLTLRADVTNDAEGGTVYWVADGVEAGTGLSYTMENLRADVHVQAQYRYGARVLAQSQTQTVHVQTGFFARLAAFFRALFGKLPKIIQSF